MDKTQMTSTSVTLTEAGFRLMALKGRLRIWAIKALAGRSAVVINVEVRPSKPGESMLYASNGMNMYVAASSFHEGCTVIAQSHEQRSTNPLKKVWFLRLVKQGAYHARPFFNPREQRGDLLGAPDRL